MGQLYETVKQIEAVIAKKGLPQFRMKGLIAIRVGFALSLVNDRTPDDPAKIAALRAAAKEVLGEPVA